MSFRESEFATLTGPAIDRGVDTTSSSSSSLFASSVLPTLRQRISGGIATESS